MKESFQLKETFNTPVATLYAAWLNSEIHSEMTGGEAECNPIIGGSFSAWDGYIWGKNIELKKNEKILQSWRTTEFQEDDQDSTLTIEFKSIGEKTELVLIHTNIPEGQTQYKQGWIDHYFTPMKSFFG